MKNISFNLTTEQIRNQTKTVTRRIGWKSPRMPKPGEILNACVKCQGLKKGEQIEKICQIRVISARREPLGQVTMEECRKEGFPGMTTMEFVLMFCREMKCSRTQEVTRIEFEYID